MQCHRELPGPARCETGRHQRAPSTQRAHARILVVDDEPDACESLRQVLIGEGYEVCAETSATRALELLPNGHFDMVLADVSMVELNGLELCRRMVATHPGLPVVLVTGQGTMETVISALRTGACDFLTKPIDAATVLACVERALSASATSRTSAEPSGAASAHDSEPSTAQLLGNSPAARTLHAFVQGLRDSTATVLIQGETGAGKEVVARAIHASSRFSRGPFIALNCAAMPAQLLESELFGHTRGAFTGAVAARDGLLVQANGGTLLLDEIGELALSLQAKLLRALQERVVRPVGASNETSFDCRIIAATNRDLQSEVAGRRFREDLFYRLDVLRIDVPPLRDRGADILLLANHFLRRFGRPSGRHRLSEHAAERLLAYPWPGNVRELENCIESATTLSNSDEISLADLPKRIRFFDAREDSPAVVESVGTRGDESIPNVVSLSEIERHHILRAVRLLRGNRTRAAELLGIDRRTLYRRLREYGELPQHAIVDAE